MQAFKIWLTFTFHISSSLKVKSNGVIGLEIWFPVSVYIGKHLHISLRLAVIGTWKFVANPPCVLSMGQNSPHTPPPPFTITAGRFLLNSNHFITVSEGRLSRTMKSTGYIKYFLDIMLTHIHTYAELARFNNTWTHKSTDERHTETNW